MYSCNPSESTGVCGIHCENMSHTMHLHGGSESRIMHLNTQNAGVHHNSSPHTIHGIAVAE